MGLITDMNSLGTGMSRVRHQVNSMRNMQRFANATAVVDLQAEIDVLERQIVAWKREWVRLSRLYIQEESGL
jgi:hypothetical protein